MKKWDIHIGTTETTFTAQMEKKTITLSTEAGLSALDFLYIDWGVFLDELKEIRKLQPQERKIVHSRLMMPETAPYYRFARWCRQAVEFLRGINPVYAENFQEWLRFEIERPYLTAYCGSEESFNLAKILREIAGNCFDEKRVKKYIHDIRPSAEKEMVADRILWFVDAYPDFPDDAQFSVDKKWMDKYQSGAEPLNQMEILQIRRWTEGEESEALETMVWECDTTANVDDASLCEVTQETVERLIEWMEVLPTYQEHLTTLIAYTLDADEVQNVDITKERLNTLTEMPEYQALEKARTAVYREAAMPWNRELSPYLFSPLLLVLDEFEWLCRHRRRKLIKCRNCGKYFVIDGLKAIYCMRKYENSEETCREYANRRKMENPDWEEIDRIHETARDSYSRRLRNAPNRNTEAGRRNREQFEAWKKMAIEQRDRARNGEISVEELREALK